MRVVVASSDSESTDWLERVLRAGGMSVVVVPDADPQTPDLRTADVVIVDRESAEALVDSMLKRFVLMVPRGGTLEMKVVTGGFAEIVVVPSDEEDVVARVRHAAR